MNQGWVYIFVNASNPGYAKVGRTQRPPLQRAQELSAATGVPTPFVLAFAQKFEDCVAAERDVHAELDRRGCRINQHREFFLAPVSEIIRIILDLVDRALPPGAVIPSADGERLYRIGEQALHGTGNQLQDIGEALRLFRLATSRGCIAAYEHIGGIYAWRAASRKPRDSRQRAVTAFNEGARRGNYYCYTRLAELFAADRHVENFAKSWRLFFEQRADAYKPELEREADHYVAALARYIDDALALGLPPAHLLELRASYADVMAFMVQQLDAAAPINSAARWYCIRILGWCFENIAPRRAPARTAPRLSDDRTSRRLRQPEPLLA